MGAMISAPLGALGTCAGSIIGSCCASLACRACSCACYASQRIASITYTLLISAAVCCALIFESGGGDIAIGGTTNHTAQNWMEHARATAMHAAVSTGQSAWNSRFWCAPRHEGGWLICCEDVCSGVFSVYRFSFTLAAFFATMMILTCVKSKFGARAHRGYWLLKATSLAAMLVSSLWISNSFLESYRELARYLSLAFLLLQILLIIDFAYSWNEKWCAYDDDAQTEGLCGWKLAIILSALAMYGASVTGWVLMYVHFGHSDCPAQQTIITVTIISCVALTALSCSKLAPHGTLLTSAAVTAYASFLCYSALASHPDGDCNPFAARESTSLGEVLVGLLVASISMASTALNAAGSKEQLIGRSDAAGDMSKPLDDSKEDADEIEPESWWYYHLMMLACSLYLSMLLTDWSTQPAQEGAVSLGPSLAAAGHYSVGLPSFWVKLSSQWVCLLVYGWTLLAPYLLREHRDFGIEFDF